MPDAPLPTLADIAADLTAGRTTAVELAEQALARAQDPTGEGARVFVRLDPEAAIAQARASDLLRAAGIQRSALEGIPVSVKDLFDIAGQVTQAGSTVLADAPPAEADAPVVARLRAAGAVIVGRTNMTEFAFSGLGINPHFGTPRNPWERAVGRIPGGSSSGAAVSVTDGMAAVGVGSDTGGSVRIPAALCGLTGFKPTQRRIPTAGAVPLSTSLDSIGPLARSVSCCALLDALMAGDEPGPLLPRALESVRFLVPTTAVLDGMDDTVAAAFERALRTLREAGAVLVEASVPEFGEIGALYARGSLPGAESYAWHRGLFATRADEYDPMVRVRIEKGAEMSAADYIELLAARGRWIARVEARLAPFDALLMPTVPVIAPAIAELERDESRYVQANQLILRNPMLINLLDGCGLSLPCHRPGIEAPVGLSIAGPAGADARLLALGRAIEIALKAAV